MRCSPKLLLTATLSAAVSLAKVSTAAPRNITQKDFRLWTETIEKARINVGVQGLSVAVVYKGETIYAQGFGKRNDKDPFTAETTASIASLTKAFTAAIVGELIAEGKADWLTPINEYIPEFKSKNPFMTAEINLVDVLSHRTGYPNLNYHWYNRTEGRSELIKKLRHVDPVAPLRTQWSYNNVMFSLAGEAAGRIDGKSWEEVVRDRILIPAGMTNTGFSIKTLVTRPNHALPYASKSFEAAQRGKNYQIPPDTLPLNDPSSGDIFSNVIDLAKWAKIMLGEGKLNGKQVLHSTTIQAVTKGQMVLGNSAYGLGWAIQNYQGHRMINHDGSYSGYRSYMTLLPDDDLAVMVMTNKKGSNAHTHVAAYLMEYILGLPKTKDWLFEGLVKNDMAYYQQQAIESLERFFPLQVKNKPPTRKLEDFAGEWTNAYGAPVSLTVNSKGKLKYKVFGREGTLEHYHYDSFRLRNLHPTFPVVAFLTFMTGESGSVEILQMTVSEGTVVYTKPAVLDATQK
ncbi:hypothetical protein DFQ26_001955 [Actinomortierella ambigua]|nr:hypothetical protein DFQ26_001955 [Actinomortierella ambigua]